MADEFGITLDSSGVPWRHALLESDDEGDENPSPESLFHFDGVFEGKKLDTAPMLVCVGQLASDFAVSHLLQRVVAPSYTLCTSSSEAVYPRYSGAPEKGEGEKAVSAFYEQGNSKRTVVVHTKELRRGVEMAWAEKVRDIAVYY